MREGFRWVGGLAFLLMVVVGKFVIIFDVCRFLIFVLIFLGVEYLLFLYKLGVLFMFIELCYIGNIIGFIGFCLNFELRF